MSSSSPSPRTARAGARTQRRAFTLVEMLVVIGVIVLLLALLLPALNVARKNSRWAGSQNNLRQIFTLMTSYSTDNREYIVPSRFDYTASTAPVKVRTWTAGAVLPGGLAPLGEQKKGSWTDILWTTAGMGPISFFAGDAGAANVYDYRYDSPDRNVFAVLPGYDSLFRSKIDNSFNAKNPTVAEAIPFGDGAQEVGEPGYFAANDFFDSTGGTWWTTGQIKHPNLAIYAVDSCYGEAIPQTADAWDGRKQNDPAAKGQVDFRYVGDAALLLLLDGRIATQPRWDDLADLQNTGQLRVQNLDK
ncbi:MAG: prepilin-type N-terminal cleavage/methylation domain-containing protein [Phycisphaerales bacterium]